VAKLADPKGPDAPMEEPMGPSPPVETQAQSGSGQVPKEGVTAGDIALQKAAAAAPDPKTDPYGYLIYIMEQGFGSVHARLNQQGKLVADMAERVYGPQKEGSPAPARGPGLAGLINDETINRALDLIKTQMAPPINPQDAIALDIGHRVLQGATDTAVRSIFRSVGKDAAGAITHVG